MPTQHELEIDLRRRFVEQAAARRPRLPGNLKQLGAVGPVTRPLSAHSQKAFVKVGITNATTTGKHLSYLQHAKGQDKQEAALFGPGATDKRQFVQAAKEDPHQFRIVVQVPAHRLLDRTRYIALFMAQVEKDLGRPLDWTAAHHSDTPYPHTHIVLRGQDRYGKDLYMERHYMTHGIRARAAEVLTWLLGPVRQQQQFIQSDRQIYDGVTRSNDDPDNRARQQISLLTGTSAPRLQPLPTLDPGPGTGPAPHVRSQADLLASARLLAGDAAAPRSQPVAARAGLGASPPEASLTAGLAALRQVLQAQQQSQQQSQQRGQGMGW
jgi:hypothetical protein